MLLNSQLVMEISELQRKALLIQKVPQQPFEPVAYCKDAYKNVFTILQSFVADEKSAPAKLVSCTNEIGTHLFSTLESHFSIAIHQASTQDNSLIQKQHKTLRERLSSTITSLIISETNYQG